MGKRAETYEREKLYEEVWKEPVLVVAKRYGVSEVALAKACRKGSRLPRSPTKVPEYLYCTINGWQRTFRFGVNRFPPIKGLPGKRGGYDEWDRLEVV